MLNEIKLTTNLPDFSAQLRRFGADFERGTVRAATNAAAKVFKKMVIAEAPIFKGFDRRKKNPRISGVLKKSIYAVRSKKSKPGLESYVVGFRTGYKAAKTGRDAFYGKFLEHGWTPRGPGKSLRGGDRYKKLQRARNIAGGAKFITKYAFMRPGYERGKAPALATFVRRIELRIAKESLKS